MKISFVILLGTMLTISASAFAGDYCQARQKLEAKIELAKALDVDTTDIKVVAYTPGQWFSEESGDHTGSDAVTVAHKSDGNKIQRRYIVSAKQIDDAADCQITRILAPR